MNRKERRKLSKNLGIMEFQRNLPLDKKLNLIKDNIAAGKQIHKEFLDKVRVNLNKQQEELESKIVFDLAQNIAKNKNISYIQAMEEAQEKYNMQKVQKK